MADHSEDKRRNKDVAFSVEQIRRAQARWELHLAILQEEEARIVGALEAYSRTGAGLPNEAFDRLKAARAQCNEAFQSLMAAIDRGATRKAVAAEMGGPAGDC